MSADSTYKHPKTMQRLGRKVLNTFGKVFSLRRNDYQKTEQGEDNKDLPNRPIIVMDEPNFRDQKRVSPIPYNVTRSNRSTVMASDQAQSELDLDSYDCTSEEIVLRTGKSSSNLGMTTRKQAQKELSTGPNHRRRNNVNVACGMRNIAVEKCTGTLPPKTSHPKTFRALTLGIACTLKASSSEITVTTIAHTRLYTLTELAFMAFMRVQGQNIFQSISFVCLDPISALGDRAIQSLRQKLLDLSLDVGEITKPRGQFRTGSDVYPQSTAPWAQHSMITATHQETLKLSPALSLDNASGIESPTNPTLPNSVSSEGIGLFELDALKKLPIFKGASDKVVCHSYPPNGFIVHPKEYYAYEQESRLMAKLANEGRGRKTDKEGEYPPEYLKGMVGTNAAAVFAAPSKGRCEAGECTHVCNPCYPERRTFNVNTLVQLSNLSAMSKDQFRERVKLTVAQQAANDRMHFKGTIHALIDVDGPSGLVIYPPYNEIEILGQRVLEPSVLPPDATIPVAEEWQYPFELNLARFLPDCRIVLHFSNPVVNVMLDYRIQDIIRPDFENVDSLTALAYLDNGRHKRRAEAYYRVPFTRQYRASGMLGQVIRIQVTNTLTNDLRALYAPPDLEPDEWSMQRIGGKFIEMYRVIPKNMVEVQPWSHALMLGGRVDTDWDVHAGFENSGANEGQYVWEKLKSFVRATDPERVFDVVKIYCDYTGKAESTWLRACDDPYQLPPETLRSFGIAISGDSEKSRAGKSDPPGNSTAKKDTQDEEGHKWASTIAFSSYSDLSEESGRSMGSDVDDHRDADQGASQDFPMDSADDDAADQVWFAQKVAEFDAMIQEYTTKLDTHFAKHNNGGDHDEYDGPDLGYDNDSCVSDGVDGNCQACHMKLGARKNLAGINDWLDDIEQHRIGCWKKAITHGEKEDSKEEAAIEVDEASLQWHNILVLDTLNNRKTREQGGLVHWHRAWLSIASQPMERESAAVQLPESGGCTIIADAVSSVHNLELHYVVKSRMLVLAADRISYFDIVQDVSSDQEEEKCQKALTDGWWRPNLEAVGIPCTMLSRLPITWVMVDSAPSWCKPGFDLGPQQSRQVDPGFCSPR